MAVHSERLMLDLRDARKRAGSGSVRAAAPRPSAVSICMNCERLQQYA
jgi:hypothetical protein